MLSLEDSRRRNLLLQAEYEDGLSALAAYVFFYIQPSSGAHIGHLRLVDRAQLMTQKMLKRSLGDRTWRRDDIATEIKRICADVDVYLNVHMVSSAACSLPSLTRCFQIKTLDVMHS
jgi:hypothetical protein